MSWVKIGLANSSVDELTPLTDTISDLQYTSDGGSYAKVVFRHRYYASRCGRRQRRGEQRTLCIQRAPEPFVYKK